MPLTRNDRPLVLALLKAMDRAEAGRTITTEADARGLLEDPRTDLAADGTVLLDDDGAPLGFAVVRTLVSQRRIRLTVGVEPAAADRAGSILLDRAIARAAVIAAAAGRPPAQVETWQLPGALLTTALEAAGWRTDRRFSRLHGSTAGRQRTVEPPGVRLESGLTDRRAVAVHEVLESAFTDHWNHRPRLLDRFLEEERGADGFDPDLWYLATADGRPAGALIGRRPGGAGWIAALGTLAQHRGRGIGRLLLSAVLGDLADRGARAVELDVDTGNTTSALRLYEGFGLTPRYQVDRWCPSPPAPGAARH